jgi:hypothetical protein
MLYTCIFILKLMLLKDKIMNKITEHPKLVIFGIGLAVTFVIGTAIGTVDHNQAFAGIHIGSSQSQPSHGR